MIPKGIPGWKLFDMSKWTETDRELDVKYMRALRDEIKRHIESLNNIDKANVEIAMTEDSLYTDEGDSLYRRGDRLSRPGLRQAFEERDQGYHVPGVQGRGEQAQA